MTDVMATGTWDMGMNMAYHDLNQEADIMVRTLLDEIDKAAPAWAEMVRICAMIANIRFRQKSMLRERDHLSGANPFPAGGATTLPRYSTQP